MSASLSLVAEDVIREHVAELYMAAEVLCQGRAVEADRLVEDAAIVAFHRFHELTDLDDARVWLLAILVRIHQDEPPGHRPRYAPIIPRA